MRYAIDVAYIFASVKAITVKFLVWENTTRKELHPLELTKKVTRTVARKFSIGGLDILKIDKNSTDLYCFMFQFGGFGALFGGLRPRGDGTEGNYRICL